MNYLWKLCRSVPLLALLCWAVTTPVAADTLAMRGCDRQEVVEFWETDITGQSISGHGGLCNRGKSLFSSVTIDGLTAGNAYTSWWVYIDDPASCADFPLPVPDVIPFPEPDDYANACGLADFFTMDPSGEFLNPLVVFGRMDGTIVPHTRKGRFHGTWRDFKPSPGSQVWVFVFGHGPADISDNRQLARQLLTPEDPTSGIPHVGIEGRPYGYPSAVAVFEID